MFYLKIAFQSKIKKYALTSISQIKFQQIIHHLSLQNKWRECLFYYQLVTDFTQSQAQSMLEFTEEELIEYLRKLNIEDKSTIKLRIHKKILMSEEDKRRKESQDSLELPIMIQKKRSKSMEMADAFDQACRTDVFEVTEQFNFQQKQENSISYKINLENDANKEQKSPLTTDYLMHRVANSKISCHRQTQLEIKSSSLQSENDLRLSFSSKLTNPKFQSVNSIAKCLHESLRITTQQKSQLERLNKKISRRQKQLGLEKAKSQIRGLFGLLGI